MVRPASSAILDARDNSLWKIEVSSDVTSWDGFCICCAARSLVNSFILFFLLVMKLQGASFWIRVLNDEAKSLLQNKLENKRSKWTERMWSPLSLGKVYIKFNPTKILHIWNYLGINAAVWQPHEWTVFITHRTHDDICSLADFFTGKQNRKGLLFDLMT